MSDISIIVLPLLMSLFINIFFIFSIQKFKFFNLSDKTKEPQYIHEGQISRLGGISIFITFISVYLAYDQFKQKYFLYMSFLFFYRGY